MADLSQWRPFLNHRLFNMSIHIRCRMTASLRATATRALFMLLRFAMRMPHALREDHFATTRQAQTVINQWLEQYNYIRPHHALCMRPPVPETLLENRHLSGAAQGG